jgi:hypothetical protein
MESLMHFSLTALLLLAGANSQDKVFAKYKPIQAYEIRPGMLAIPRYSADGKMCQVRVERVGRTLLQHEIDPIAEELAPVAARGRRWKGLDENIAIGLGYSKETVYEDVTIVTSGNIYPTCTGLNDYRVTGPLEFTIVWTKRKCV